MRISDIAGFIFSVTVKGFTTQHLCNSALKIMAWFLCHRYDFSINSKEWQHNSKGEALQTKFGPCPPTPIYDR
jgi:hypothetical protein